MAYFLNLLFLIYVHSVYSQEVTKDNPNTILWSVSKPGFAKPSYLLGINHVVSADWLLTFPEIKNAITSSEILMTEMYGDNERAVFGNNPATDARNRAGINLRAMDLLTPEQYASVDSFFVAQIGEGITNNPDAQQMNVWEFSSAIMMTLLNGKSSQGVTLPCMDRELFGIFKKNQKKTIALDHIENLEFASQDSVKAREVLSKFVEASRQTANSAEWNLADTSFATGKFVYNYKMMSFDYLLDQTDPEKSSLIGSHTSLERNLDWMPEIESAIAKNQALIAVGALHLYYKTGLVSLLREKGYKVEPVKITRR